MTHARRIVLDNGAYSIKAGYSTSEDPQWDIPNCVAITKILHQLTGDEIFSKMKDHSQLRFSRPFDRGYLIDPAMQEKIWNRLFHKDLMDVTDFRNESLLVTEPPLNLETIQDSYNQLVFETFGFSEHVRCGTAGLVITEYQQEHESFAPSGLGVVVDSGFSFTHSIPVLNGSEISTAIRRLNVGGKLLTNYLKEIVSYRSFNMMDENVLINDVKEQLCYVSQQFDLDMEISQRRGRSANTISREFVLPDYKAILRGFPKDDDVAEARGVVLTGAEQTLVLNRERMSIPEVLFHPSDIGIRQAGVAGTLVQTINATHPHLHRDLYSNILLVGGSTKFPGFKARFETELRQLVPAEFPIKVFQTENTLTSAWRGGSMLCRDEGLWREKAVTKAEYEEHGHRICRMRFNNNSL